LETPLFPFFGTSATDLIGSSSLTTPSIHVHTPNHPPHRTHSSTQLTNPIIATTTINQGLIGTAPSKELLDIWNEREAALVEAGPEGTTLGGVLHTRPLGGCFALVFGVGGGLDGVD